MTYTDARKLDTTISHPKHGSFNVNSDKLGAMIVHVTGDVNYRLDYLQAWVTETTGFRYFDVNIVQVCALLVEFGHEPHTVSWFLAHESTTNEWLQSVRDGMWEE